MPTRFRERAEPPATSIESQRVCHFLSLFFRRAGEMSRTLRTFCRIRKKTWTHDSHNVAILETIRDISSLGIVAGMVFYAGSRLPSLPLPMKLFFAAIDMIFDVLCLSAEKCEEKAAEKAHLEEEKFRRAHFHIFTWSPKILDLPTSHTSLPLSLRPTTPSSPAPTPGFSRSRASSRSPAPSASAPTTSPTPSPHPWGRKP